MHPIAMQVGQHCGYRKQVCRIEICLGNGKTLFYCKTLHLKQETIQGQLFAMYPLCLERKKKVFLLCFGTHRQAWLRCVGHGGSTGQLSCSVMRGLFDKMGTCGADVALYLYMLTRSPPLSACDTIRQVHFYQSLGYSSEGGRNIKEMITLWVVYMNMPLSFALLFDKILQMQCISAVWELFGEKKKATFKPLFAA